MSAAKLALCLGIASIFSAQTQSEGIAERLRQALAATGNADQALSELTKRNFSTVDRLLAAAPAQDSKARAQLSSLRGAVAFLRGDMTAAASHFEAAEKLAPLTDPDTFTEAMAFVHLGNPLAARKLLEQLESRHPDHALYIYWLGRLDFDQHRYEQAATELRNAVTINPDWARAWDSLGLALDMQGVAEDAREALEKSVALNRREPHPSAWPPHDLGYWLLRMNRLQEAEMALRESLRYDQYFPPAHYHLGRTLEKQGRDPEAVAEYLAAVKNDSASADACYSLAILYRKLNRETEASDMFAEYRRRKQAQP